MALVPPVSRGSFHYDGNLYIEVGNFNRHKRASIEEISAVLRPALKKSKTASTDPPKDQVGHWYEAQLIHYGLPPSKDKARAKLRLLEALNNSQLSVPPNVAVMEAEMKKEYASAERKAKAQYKAGQTLSMKQSEPVTTSKKRKQPEPSGNVNSINVNINLGNGFQGFSDPAAANNNQSPTKKAKAAPSKPAKKNAGETGPRSTKKTAVSENERQLSQTPPLSKRTKQTARSATLTAAWLKDPSRGPGPVNRAALGYPDPMPSPFNSTAGDQPSTSSTKAEVTARRSVTKAQPKVKQEAKIKSEPQIKNEPKVKKEPKARPSSQVKQELGPDDPPSPNKPSLGLINGIYDIDCPTVEEQWDCTDTTLILTLDGTSVWGAYDLGMFSGIIFLANRPWQPSNSPIPFSWRGREEGEGEMSFGDDCEGEIAFLGNGVIEGWISVHGRCEFQGRRRPEAGTAVRGARSMREEWEGYNEEAYEEERVGRW